MGFVELVYLAYALHNRHQLVSFPYSRSSIPRRHVLHTDCCSNLASLLILGHLEDCGTHLSSIHALGILLVPLLEGLGRLDARRQGILGELEFDLSGFGFDVDEGRLVLDGGALFDQLQCIFSSRVSIFLQVPCG